MTIRDRDCYRTFKHELELRQEAPQVPVRNNKESAYVREKGSGTTERNDGRKEGGRVLFKYCMADGLQQVL